MPKKALGVLSNLRKWAIPNTKKTTKDKCPKGLCNALNFVDRACNVLFFLAVSQRCHSTWCLRMVHEPYGRTPESPPKCLIPKSQTFAIFIRTIAQAKKISSPLRGPPFWGSRRVHMFLFSIVVYYMMECMLSSTLCWKWSLKASTNVSSTWALQKSKIFRVAIGHYATVI